MEWQCTKVFAEIVKAHQDNYRVIVEEGGSRSSKTWSIFQFYILHALTGDNWKITICRDKLSWIKSTLLPDFAESKSIMITGEIIGTGRTYG